MDVFDYDMRWIDEDAAQQLLSGFNETLKCLRADRQTDKTDRHTAQLLAALPHRILSTISMYNSTIPWLDKGIDPNYGRTFSTHRSDLFFFSAKFSCFILFEISCLLKI